MSSIRLKRSAVPGKVPSIEQLELGEVAVNTHDGRMFFKRDQSGNAVIREMGARDATRNVFYVTEDGSDDNDGKTVGDGFATIKKALSVCGEGSTVYVKSGVHYLDNPVKVPAYCAIVGDSLRTSVIESMNPKEDMFWVNNGSFLKDLRIKGHESPAAAVAFPPDGSAGAIFTSPYVQNVTSATTTGTGMRIDGSHVEGFKSMVVDAYTQYNQGGIGVHHLNGGNSQLVSIFTICCDISILCESGGFCSLTNSNSSFGTYGLVADGFSPALYSATTGAVLSPSSLIVNNLTEVPYIQNAAQFSKTGETYTVSAATPLQVGNGVITGPTLTQESATLQSERATVLESKEVIQKTVIDYINGKYPLLEYNQAKCYRDVGLILEAVLDDMVLDTNYRTVVAARSYYRGTAGLVLTGQLAETVDGVEKARQEILALTSDATAEARINASFDVIVDVMQNGDEQLPTIVYNTPTGVLPEVNRAKQSLELNKDYLIEEGIAYIAQTTPLLGYDREKCERDVGLVIDALGFDLMFGSDFRSIVAGRSYYRGSASVVTDSQLTATIQAFRRVKTLAMLAVDSAAAKASIEANMDTVLDILTRGLAAAPAYTVTTPTGGTNNASDADILNARDNIDDNRSFIKAEVLANVATNFPGLNYDTAKCARDVDYILDAVYYDLSYGGNLETLIAGRSYYDGNDLQLANDTQKTATITAYTYLSELVRNIALAQDVAELQTAIAQVTVAQTAANADAAQRASNLIDDVITIVSDDSSEPVAVEPDTSWVVADLLAANTALQEEKTEIQLKITDFIEKPFTYNEAKCERDTAFAIDAASYDLALGTNYNAVTTGLSYTRENTAYLQSEQKEITIAALEYARDQSAAAITSGTGTGLSNAAFNEIINIFDKGASAADALVFPAASYSTGDQQTAVSELQTDRATLQSGIISWLSSNYPDLGYDQAKCSRDVGLLVDALCYDILYGGNSASVKAAESYFVGTQSQLGADEVVATVAAYGELQTQVIASITPSTEEQTASNLLQIVIDVITVGNLSGLPDVVYPVVASETNAPSFTELQDAKVSVITDTITWINSTFGGFAYDTATCRRDFGYIIDGLVYDVLYKGNSQSYDVGIQYYSAGQLQIPGVQRDATGDALFHLQTRVGDVLRSNNVVPLQTKVSQNTSIASTTITEIQRTQNLVSIIESVVRRSYFINDFIELTQPNFAAQSSVANEIRDVIQAGKEQIQIDTIDYINESFQLFEYDKTLCARDVGLMLDAVAMDTALGTNYNAVVAGLSYTRANSSINTVKSLQYSQTLGAIRFVKERTLALAGLSATGITRVTAAFDEIISIFQSNEPSALSFPNPSLADQDLIDAKDQLQANREFLKSEIVAYIDQEFKQFTYNEDKCRRDTGIAIDAAKYDLVIGTNYNAVTSGLAYTRANSAYLLSEQKDETVGALEYARDQSAAAITDGTATGLSNAAFNEIIDILENGVSAANAVSFPTVSGLTSTDEESAKNRLQANKEFLKAEVVAYLEKNFGGLYYDQAKCERDTAIAIDAAAYDLALGTNYNAVTTGLSYTRANTAYLQSDQKTETIAALEFARDQAAAAITDGTATGLSNAAFNEIIDVLDNGVGNADALSITAASYSSTNEQNAVAQLAANKAFLQAEILAYIQANYLDVYNAMDTAKCSRDVGYIVDALRYDIMYGGNSASVKAAEAYFVGTESQLGEGQQAATVAAYDYLASAVGFVIREITGWNITGSQDTAGTAGTITEATTAATRVDIIKNVIQAGNLDNLPTVINPTIDDETNFASAEELFAATATIVAATINFIETTFPTLIYDQVKCERDVGYLVDALSYDIMYGGNSASVRAADAYFVGTASQLGSIEEQTATARAYDYLASAAEFTILGTTADATTGFPIQSTVAQDATGSNGTSTEATQASTLLQIVEDVITAGNLDGLPSVTNPDETGLTNEASFDELETAKTTVVDDTITFINTTYGGFTYDEAKCRRDLDIILDAVALDSVLNTNYNTVTAGLAYRRANASEVIDSQLIQTVGAIKFAREQVDNNADLSVKGRTRIVRLIDDILDVIESNTVENVEFNVPGNATQNQADAMIQLVYNKPFLQDEIEYWIAENRNDVFAYDEAKCERDTGLVVDAASYDLVLGTNYNAVTAGLAYTRGNSSYLNSTQKTETIAALGEAKALAAAAITDGTATGLSNAAFDEVIDVLTNGTANADALVFPAASGLTVGTAETSKNALVAARSSLQTGISTFISNNYPVLALSYNQAKCERDVGYLVDALCYDIMYGGNAASIEAAKTYFFGTVSQLAEGQESATIASYNQLITLAQAEVEAAEDARVATLLGYTITVITDGNVDALPAPTYPDETGLTNEASFDELQAARQTVIDGTISFINTTYNIYDVEKCKRDVGYIVDAITHDMLYGGNTASRFAAESYFVGATSQLGDAAEVAASIAAYGHLKTVVADVVQNIAVTPSLGNATEQKQASDPASATEAALLQDGIDVIIDALTAGNINSLPAEVLPTITWAEQALQDDFAIVQTVKSTVIDDTIDFISSEYQTFDYDEAKCARDVGYIVDGLTYDVLYGGNSATRTVTRSYFSKAANQLGAGETEATIAAYKRLQSVVADVVQGVSVTASPTNRETQNTASGNATTAQATTLTTLVQDIIDALLIESTNKLPDEVVPSVTWATAGLQNDFAIVKGSIEPAKVATIGFIDERYGNFDYNAFKCSRDVGLIIDAVTADMVMDTNYRSIIAGTSYYRKSSIEVIDNQLAETLNSLRFARDKSLALIQDDTTLVVSEEYQKLAARWEDVINVIEQGEVAAPDIEYLAPDDSTVGEENAVRILQANRQFLIEESVAFISKNFPMIGYNRALCERDVGLIVDALSYDLMFGSNFRTVTAGRSYYRKGSAVVLESQKEATIASYERLKTLAVDAVDDATAKTSIANNMDLLVDIIKVGELAVPSSYTTPTPTSGSNNASDAGYLNARNNIDANKSFITEEVVAYVETNYPNFVYDQAKCARDVAFVIEALKWDLQFGSDFRSVVAGRSYTRGTGALPAAQVGPTLDAFRLLKELAADAVKDATAEASIRSNMDIIIDIIGGTAAPTAFTIPSPTGYNTTYLPGYGDARENIDANRAFIAAEVLEFINVNHNAVFLSMDQAKCSRDVGYILDAIYFDLTYGGNLETTVAGRSYYEDALAAGQETATLDAYGYLSALVEQVARNQTIAALQVVTTQTTAGLSAATNAAALQAGALVDDIITYISDDSTSPRVVEPGNQWVSTSLVEAYIDLENSVERIKTAVTSQVNTTFSYDEVACRRDVDRILDALYYDITYGGNLETLIAAKAYYSGTDLQLSRNEEKEITIAAYGYLETLVETVALNNSVGSPLQSVVTQTTTGLTAGSAAGSQAAGDRIVEIYTYLDADSTVLTEIAPDTTWVAAGLTTANTTLQAAKTTFAANLTDFIEANYAYKEAVCRRDVGLIVDALCYDVLYGGNSQSHHAAETYFSGGALQIPAFTKDATVRTYKHLREVAQDLVANIVLSPLQDSVVQDTSLSAATATESQLVYDLLTVIVNITEHGYSSTVTFDLNIGTRPTLNEEITFHQTSLITASGQTFEWVGSGVNVNSALPYTGGQPIEDQQVIETNNGKVYFTSTDQKGDFKIGNSLTIERATGTITGETFDRSLFAVLTPYILALQ